MLGDVRGCLISVLLLLGCGRIEYRSIAEMDATVDAVVDAPADAVVDAAPDDASVMHDEDGDGFADAIDNCPHVANTDQTNGDGDGVGDDCDPNLGSPRDAIAFFDPFISLRPEWIFTGPSPTFAGDALVIDTTPAATQFVAALPAAAAEEDLYAYSGRIVAIGPGENHLMLGLGEAPLFPNLPAVSSFYYCEACVNGNCSSTPFFALTSRVDNGPFRAIGLVGMQPFAPGPFTHAFQQTPPTLQCSTTLPADAQMLAGPMPTGIIPMRAGIKVIGLHVELEYFIQIHTDP